MTTYKSANGKNIAISRKYRGEKGVNENARYLRDTYDLVSGTITMKNYTSLSQGRTKDGSRWE